MTKPRPVRMRDIADELGISLSLVSKVLSGRLGTSSARPELAARIHEAAARLGYRLNAASSALARGWQGAVAVLLSGRPGPGRSDRPLRGLSPMLTARGLRLVLHFFDTEDEFRTGLSQLSPNIVDGVLFGGPGFVPDCAREELERVHRSGLPVVTFLGTPRLSPLISNVGLSQEKVGEVAARHLLERGCRRILFVRVGSITAPIRERGFRRALDEAAPTGAVGGTMSIADWSEEGARMRSGVRPILDEGWDGVVCGSDVGAAALVNGLADIGLRPPSALRVIGINDSPFCPYVYVPITSVSGRDSERAARALERLLDPTDTLGNEEFDPVVVAREST